MREIYLDNAATTKVCEAAVNAMVDVMTASYGNPSSLHAKGIEAERIMKAARHDIAEALGVKPTELYFTSGGTEANNMAIRGAAQAHRRKGRHLITTVLEHPSVLDVFKDLEEDGFRVTYLKADGEGRICLGELVESLTPETILVSMMYVNNEVGSVLPIREVAQILSQRENVLFHVDAVQAFGKVKMAPQLRDIDLLSVSSHKIHGPKGVGALFVRDGVRLEPLVFGGGQERGLRSGTENLPGIVGFGVATGEAFTWDLTPVMDMKKKLIDDVMTKIPDVVINGPESGGAPHIVNISFLGLRGEILLHSLEAKGVFVSTGSACSSHRKGSSHVLEAMGKTPEEVDGAVRFSISPYTTWEDIDYTVKVLKDEVSKIRKVLRR